MQLDMGKSYRIDYDAKVIISSFIVSASALVSGSGEWIKKIFTLKGLTKYLKLLQVIILVYTHLVYLHPSISAPYDVYDFLAKIL